MNGAETGGNTTEAQVISADIWGSFNAALLAFCVNHGNNHDMRTPNPELQEAHYRGIVLGAKTAAKIAKEMLASGWPDMKKFEAEVWRRVRQGTK